MFKYFTSILLSLLCVQAYAGIIKGTVTDAKNASPLTGVVVAITGTGKGAITDIDGKFEIADVPKGTFEIVFTYTSYNTFKQSITTSGEDAIVNVSMMPETTELKDHVIKSSKITNTETSVIAEIKNSSSIVSGTSAAQISKTMDRNAADVVKRIPGVTIQDDRFIVVRGLPDRYNTVWLNDASTPSSEADKKAFSFDIIPAGLIDRVMIYKTPAPDLPGDFAGGMVKVYTTSVADKNQVAVSLQTSSREFTTGSNFMYNEHSKTDWLGYDDGKRSIPSGTPGQISKTAPDYPTGINNWSKAFGNDWVTYNKPASPDARFSLALSNVFKTNKVKIGNTLGIAYSNTSVNTNTTRQDWDSATKNYHYVDQRSVNNVSAGIMDNIGVVIGNSKIEFRNLYNQIGSSSVTMRQNVRDTAVGEVMDERSYAMSYESRATYATQLTGTHKNNADTRRYTWTLGYTDLFKNQPDLRRIKYTKDSSQADSMFKAPIAGQVDLYNGGGRFYASLYEHTYSFNHMFTQKVTVNDKFNFDVNVGNYIEYKSRLYSAREFGYTIAPGPDAQKLNRLPINQIFADSNVGMTGKYIIDEGTKDYDKYFGSNKLIASFVSLKVPVGNFTVSGGARYEYNIQSITGYLNGTDTVNPEIKTKFLLPSVNTSYNFSDKSLVRVAYGKTLNRPEFREWAPTFYYDFDEIAGVKGSLFRTTASTNKSAIGDTLKVAQIQNFDVRYELYPSSGEMIQIGGFYKSFTDPIQRIIVPGSGSDSRTFTFINAQNAYCVGLELDIRKNLGWLDKKLGTNIFKDFTLTGNLSVSKSELNIDSSKIKDVVPRSTIQGQSPYIVNAGLYYQNEKSGFQGSLLYNVFGPRMYAVGTTNPEGESIGELPFQSLDCTLSKLFAGHYIINFGVQNLLGSRVSFVKDINRDNKFDSKNDRDYKYYYPGRYYSIGIKVKF